MRTHLDDNGNIILDKVYINSFHQSLESLRYKASLGITGSIKGSSTERRYHELGLESLKNKQWSQKLCFFYRFVKEQSPIYLFDLVPSNNNTY